MGKRFDFEYIVIGGGTAGATAALQFARSGRKVAIVEQDKWGGAEINYRDVPTGALLHFSHLYSQAVYGARFGISAANLRYNYPTVTHWRDKAITRAGGSSKKELEEAGVTCYLGKAHFVGQYDLAIEGAFDAETPGQKTESGIQISANKFLIATGSEMAENGITGLETVPYLTPTTALKLEKVPKVMLVVGGGASGCETAQYFAELGAKVVIVEAGARLLPHEDEEVGQVVEHYFDKRLGIKVFTQTKVVAIEQDKVSPRVVFLRGGQEKMVRVETIVLATGSRPYTDLGLQNAGVSFDKNGVVVDKTLQTSARHIYAAGDVIGGESSAERAVYTAGVAVMNMLGRTKTFVNYQGFCRVVDTDPQVAVIGATEAELDKAKRKYKKALVPLSAAPVSNMEDFKVGFIKMMADAQGKILGAAIVSPHAADVAQEIVLAMKNDLTVVQLFGTPHVRNSWSELVRLAARKLLTE